MIGALVALAGFVALTRVTAGWLAGWRGVAGVALAGVGWAITLPEVAVRMVIGIAGPIQDRPDIALEMRRVGRQLLEHGHDRKGSR